MVNCVRRLQALASRVSNTPDGGSNRWYSGTKQGSFEWCTERCVISPVSQLQALATLYSYTNQLTLTAFRDQAKLLLVAHGDAGSKLFAICKHLLAKALTLLLSGPHSRRSRTKQGSVEWCTERCVINAVCQLQALARQERKSSRSGAGVVW